MNRHRPDSSWTTDQRRAFLGGLRDVVGSEPGARADDLLALAAERLAVQADCADPAAWSVLAGDPWAEHALVALIVAGCVREEPLDSALLDRNDAYGRAAGVDGSWVRVMRLAVRGQRRRVTMALTRVTPDAKYMLSQSWRLGGVREVLNGVLAASGRSFRDEERGWFFKRLGLLPDGTVGRTFWANMTERGIALPGEPGGLPEAGVHHDLLHTLTGYDTDGAGESLLAGFYAGFGYEGWPAWVLVALVTFELGLDVGPSFVPPRTGQFDVRGVLAAFERARGAAFHPMDPGWDYRELMPLPLTEARARLAI